jgi:hypothetical protein
LSHFLLLLLHLRQICNGSCTRTRASARNNALCTVITYWLRSTLYRDTAPVPISSIIHREKDPVVYQTCTATAPVRKKICTMTAKSAPYLPCTVTTFRLKNQDSARMLRRVTQPPHIAGPLVAMCALNDNVRKTEVNAVIKMEVDPPQVLYRRNLQTAPRCFPGDWKVLNGWGKKSCRKD